MEGDLNAVHCRTKHLPPISIVVRPASKIVTAVAVLATRSPCGFGSSFLYLAHRNISAAQAHASQRALARNRAYNQALCSGTCTGPDTPLLPNTAHVVQESSHLSSRPRLEPYP